VIGGPCRILLATNRKLIRHTSASDAMVLDFDFDVR
jgi:hypothetical protein